MRYNVLRASILHAIEENKISYQFSVVSMTNSVINTKKNNIVSGTKPRKISYVVARMYSGRCGHQWQGDDDRWQFRGSPTVTATAKVAQFSGFPASKKVE